MRTTMTGSVTVPQGRFPFVAIGRFVGTATSGLDVALPAGVIDAVVRVARGVP